MIPKQLKIKDRTFVFANMCVVTGPFSSRVAMTLPHLSSYPITVHSNKAAATSPSDK